MLKMAFKKVRKSMDQSDTYEQYVAAKLTLYQMTEFCRRQIKVFFNDEFSLK